MPCDPFEQTIPLGADLLPFEFLGGEYNLSLPPPKPFPLLASGTELLVSNGGGRIGGRIGHWMIEGEGSWRSQGRDVSCLITMSSASLPPNTNSEANAFPHTVVHRNAPPDRNAPLPPCNALSISVDIVARCPASSPLEKGGGVSWNTRVLRACNFESSNGVATWFPPLLLFIFPCPLFFFLPAGKRGGNDRLSNSLTNCSKSGVVVN